MHTCDLSCWNLIFSSKGQSAEASRLLPVRSSCWEVVRYFFSSLSSCACQLHFSDAQRGWRSCKRQDYAATPSFSTHLRTDQTSVDLDLHEQGLWELTQQSAQHLLVQDGFWLSWKRLEKPTKSNPKNLKRIIRKHNRWLYFSEIYFKDDVRDEMSEA